MPRLLREGGEVSEYLPKNKSIWLLFDLANGHRRSRRYLWWFDSRKDAMAHRKEQHAMPHGARLSFPVRALLVAAKGDK